MHASCPIRQLSERLQGVEGPLQKRRVVMVGRGDYGSQRDAFCLHHCRAFETSFSSIHRASSRFLSTARSFGYASVHCQIGQLQPDQTIVSFEGDLSELLHQPESYPLVAPATQSALRARLIGDPPVGAAEHQDLDQLLEDQPVGDAWLVAAERMIDLSLWQEGLELLPNGFLLMYGSSAGTEHTPSIREA